MIKYQAAIKAANSKAWEWGKNWVVLENRRKND